MPSAWGVDHGSIEKGLGSALKGLGRAKKAGAGAVKAAAPGPKLGSWADDLHTPSPPPTSSMSWATSGPSKPKAAAKPASPFKINKPYAMQNKREDARHLKRAATYGQTDATSKLGRARAAGARRLDNMDVHARGDGQRYSNRGRSLYADTHTPTVRASERVDYHQGNQPKMRTSYPTRRYT